MILVIAGTDRVGSNTSKVAKHVRSLLSKSGAAVEILDLAELKPATLGGPHYGVSGPESLTAEIAKIQKADGIYMCVPEYNGSMPGALKYFIDHWKYPDSFEFRPFALCGLGGMFGGLRPVEHLQGVLGYRNAFIYPERIFIRDVGKLLKGTEAISDPILVDLFEKQINGFLSFVDALKTSGLHTNTRRR